MTGVVYSETTVYAAPEAFLADAPYQVVIISLDSGGRITGRAAGGRLAVDDRVALVETRKGVPFFQKHS